MSTWNEVPYDLWFNELAFMFLKNKETIPCAELCSWHWEAGYGPAQTYYKLSVKHAPKQFDE